jgi:hypothetical protein
MYGMYVRRIGKLSYEAAAAGAEDVEVEKTK